MEQNTAGLRADKKGHVFRVISKGRKNRWSPKGKPGQRVYAVGDIHGCLAETQALMQKIKTDNDYRDGAETFVIFLGDLVDRGPDSRGVIEHLMEFPYHFAKPLFIMGNHEEMMVRALMGEPSLLPEWLKYGGFACAESYGVPRAQLLDREPSVIEYTLRSAIPRKHVDFLGEFLDYVHFGDFLFTHAGIRPGVPLEKQNSRDLKWIRDPFLEHSGDLGVTVVHGHTISDQVEFRSNRIGVDTGAYKTGVLSALCVDESDVSMLSTA